MAEQVRNTVKKVYLFVVIGVAIGAVIHNWIPGELIVKIHGTGNLHNRNNYRRILVQSDPMSDTLSKNGNRNLNTNIQ